MKFTNDSYKALYKILEKSSTHNGNFSYMYTSKAHLMITLYIKIDKGQASYNKICTDISPQTASRATIQSILNMGVKLGIYKKITFENDMRIKKYNLSENASKDLDKLVTDLNSLICRNKK